jgi:outer membrane lipoprotein-sorting protein
MDGAAPLDRLHTAPPLIEKVRDSIERIKPFKVKFVQQVFDEDQMEIEESGEIIFKDQKTLKWTYLKPGYKVFLLKGDESKFYDRENEQLTIGKVKEKNRQWLWQLLFANEMAEYIKTDDEQKRIYIKDESDNLDIEIAINNDFLPIKAIQKDPSGAVLIYFFKDYREKIKITDSTFDLKIPAGVEIITE